MYPFEALLRFSPLQIQVVGSVALLLLLTFAQGFAGKSCLQYPNSFCSIDVFFFRDELWYVKF